MFWRQSFCRFFAGIIVRRVTTVAAIFFGVKEIRFWLRLIGQQVFLRDVFGRAEGGFRSICQGLRVSFKVR
jgi:hypothetical protein